MNAYPVIVRELRAAARRPGFFWLRGSLAAAAALQCYTMFDRAALPGPGAAAAFTGARLLTELAWLAFAAALGMVLVAVESLHRERRDGTLGLLLLTDLTPRDIVLSKLVACGLVSFAALLGFLPALMATVLAGGVSGGMALATGLGLLNSLFVALAAGLWMGAVFRDRHYAMLAAVGLVIALAFAAPLFGNALFGATAGALLSLFSLAGWLTTPRGPVPRLEYFTFWLLFTHALGWLLVWQAARALAANWRDAPHALFRRLDPYDDWLAPSAAAAPDSASPTRVSWLTDPRPWDADPLRWRVERIGVPEAAFWVATLVNFFVQFGLLAPLCNGPAAVAGSWGLLSLAGVAGICAAGGVSAWAGARFFLDTRRQQDLELLLTTPAGGRDIVRSQWNVLRPALAWPLGVVLLLTLPTGIAAISALLQGRSEEAAFFLPPFLVALNIPLETAALCAWGMQSGLRSRTVFSAAGQTVALIQLAPLALVLAAVRGWDWLQFHSAFAANHDLPAVIPVLLFLLAKNLGFFLRARSRLRRDLRLAGTRTRLDAPARALALQSA